MRKKRGVLPAHLQHRLATIHVLTHAEIQRLFAVITDARDQALFLVAYRHGLRASEVAQMETTDVDFAKTKVTIRRVSRGSHDLHPLEKDEVSALKRYLKTRQDESIVLFLSVTGKAISRRGLDWLMKQYGAKAKLPREKRHFHTLKHSVATHLLSAGADLRYVHDWLGHVALQNTALYLYLAFPPPKAQALHRNLPGPLRN